MADRVHPSDSSSSTTATASEAPDIPAKSTPPATENAIPPATENAILPPQGTYVIQIPKDQIYRVPPPENAGRYQNYTRRKHRRNPCCSCLCYLLAFVGGIIAIAGVAALIFYLVVRPESPDYSFDSISIKGLSNVTSMSPEVIVPEFDVTFRVGNPNDKIRIDYLRDMTLNIYFSDALFGYVRLPAFYQTSNNVTVFNTTLKGQRFESWSEARKALVNVQNQKTVPFKLEMRSSAKFKLGSFTTWRMRPQLFCDVTVDKLTAESKFVKKDCDYDFDLW